MTNRRLEVYNSRWLDYRPASLADFLGIGALIGGAVSGLGSLAGGLFGSSAATDAAKVQANAANQAAQLQLAMFQQMQGNLAPWMNAGSQALNSLQMFTGTASADGWNDPRNPNAFLTRPINTQFAASNIPYSRQTPLVGSGQPGESAGGVAFAPTDYGLGDVTFHPTDGFRFAPTMDNLRQTPGYQFALNQGLEAVSNQNAAMGRSGSGAMGKGLINYAEGLASTTYQNQFNNWLQTLQTQSNIYSGNLAQQYGIYSGQVGQQFGIFQGQNQLALGQKQQIYNMLGGLAGSGQNAAVNTGTAGLNAATQGGNLLTSGAAATAGGIVGSNNALFSGFSNAGAGIQNSLMNYAMINALGGGNAGGGGGSAIANIFGGSAAVGSGGPSSSGTGGLY